MITKTNKDMFAESKAVFSDDEKYRFYLERRWGEGHMLCFLMLNPSTADEMVNDATIERCQRRAIAMGYHGITIVNLFPYRMTDSKQLHTVADLLGEDEGRVANRYILTAVSYCDITICGWGNHPLAAQRAKDILELISRMELSHQIHYLVLNKDQSPRHPLYVGYAQQPQPWRLAA